MMKIVTNFAIAFVTLMLAGFVGPYQSVMAADDLGPKKSSAQLTVDAGNIMIQQVPDLNFGGISVGGMVANRKLYGQAVAADHIPHTQPAAGSFVEYRLQRIAYHAGGAEAL